MADDLNIVMQDGDESSISLAQGSSAEITIDLDENIDIGIEADEEMELSMDEVNQLDVELLDGIPAPASDYEDLSHKPQINGVELIGDKTFEDLGRDDIKNSRIKAIVDSQYEQIFGGN